MPEQMAFARKASGLYRYRLESHPYCVSLTDLLLQKLQIVQINDKDLKDAMLLLLAAPMSETDKDSINVKYLGKILSDDWGFYHTATTNLGRIAAAIADISVLKTAQKAVICEKINYLSTYLEDIPKSGKWKGRAKTGTSKQWYNEVSDWE